MDFVDGTKKARINLAYRQNENVDAEWTSKLRGPPAPDSIV